VDVPGLDEQGMIHALEQDRIDVAMLPLQAVVPRATRVDFPLRRGLLGLRVLVSRPAQAMPLSRVTELASLKRGFRMGYQRAWMDGPKLEALGFQMHFVDSYPALFDSVRRGEADYLSRGLSEVRRELNDPVNGQGLGMVPGIALFYPIDDGFFVSNLKPAERAVLETGLRQILRDGRYAALFQKHFGAALLQARVAERRVLIVRGYAPPPGISLRDFNVLQLIRPNTPPP
jgi:ABC-type amino acid transport substrate-binding protein